MAKRVWSPPGWPWELELLALIFVVAAIVFPLQIKKTHKEPVIQEEMSLIAQARIQQEQERVKPEWESSDFFWSVVIVGIYLVHLAMAGASIDFISTPFTHLFSPLLFAMIMYYRLFELSTEESTKFITNIVQGSPAEIFWWVAGTLLMTFLVARIRMARYLLRFRNVKWDFTAPTQVDATYFRLMPFLTPLLYTPRTYKAGPEGILVEGRLYVMPIPFDLVQSIGPSDRTPYTSSGDYLATSTRALVRIQLTEQHDPIYISPQHRDAFLSYCEHHAIKRSPVTSRAASSTSTRSGATTGHGTRSGTRSGRSTRS